MATTPDAIFAISAVTGLTRRAVEQRIRRHRDAGQWCNGGVGKRSTTAAHTQARDLTLFFLGLADAEPVSAPETAARLADLQCSPRREVEVWVTEGQPGPAGVLRDIRHLDQPTGLLPLGALIEAEIRYVAQHGSALHVNIDWSATLSASHLEASTGWLGRDEGGRLIRSTIRYSNGQPSLIAEAPIKRQVIVAAPLLAVLGHLLRDTQTAGREGPATLIPGYVPQGVAGGNSGPIAAPAGQNEEGPDPARSSPSSGASQEPADAVTGTQPDQAGTYDAPDGSRPSRIREVTRDHVIGEPAGEGLPDAGPQSYPVRLCAA